MPERIRVRLGPRSYDILVTAGGLEAGLGPAVRAAAGGSAALVITSPRVGALCFGPVRRSLRRAGFRRVLRHDVPDGERHKSLAEYVRALDALVRGFPDPSDAPRVVALGGGVVGDLAGFVAGTFRRGVPYVQVPTTLLACVDSGVGGKVGVNHAGVKNIVGMFHQPALVFADLAVLATLPPRQIRSGLAEVVKYGAVCDARLFAALEAGIEDVLALDGPLLRRVVADAYRIKARVVERDERDTQGRRIVLNFGHTVGHAVEMAAAPALTHGEAIAIGMVAATRLAVRLGVCAPAVRERLTALLRRAGLPVSAAGRGLRPDAVLRALRHDKKAVRGRLRFVLPTAIGSWRALAVRGPELVHWTIAAALAAPEGESPKSQLPNPN